MSAEFKNLKCFMDEYGKKYSLKMQKDIKHYYYESGVPRYFQDTYMQQIYHAIGELDPDIDPYIASLRMFQDLEFDFGCNILDVASGYYPAFAYEIAKKQLELGRGSVTCIDPDIVCEQPLYSNVTFLKQKFTNEFDLSKFDLIVSLLPCGISSTLITSVIEQMKDYFILPCSCMRMRTLDNGNTIFTNEGDIMYMAGAELCDKKGISRPDHAFCDYHPLHGKKFIYKKN